MKSMATLAGRPQDGTATRPSVVPVHLLALPDTCWRCSRPVLPLVGVLVPAPRGGVRFLEFSDVADRLRTAVPAARLRALGIGSIRRRTTRRRPEGYLANACVHCDVVLGEHPLREDLAAFLAEGGTLRELSVGQLLLPQRARA
jgi:hypothetical protein